MGIDNKMNNKDVNAVWARETASAILGAQAQKQLDDALISIKGAVARNEMSVTVQIYAEKITLEELTKRGFKVEQHDDQRDGSYLNISW